MARKLFISGLGVSLVAVVVVGVSLASASSGSGARVWGAPAGMVHFAKAGRTATSGDPTITVISKNAKETDVDEPPTGFSQGAFTSLFRVARGQFEFTATLRAGALTATGVASFTEAAGSSGFTAAVTGGTGAYRNTDGWVEVIFITDTTTKFIYHLTD